MKNIDLIYILKKLLLKNGHHATEQEIEVQLAGHPNFPNLISITDFLDHMSVDNAAIQLPNTVKSLASLPSTFIALQNDNGSEYLCMVEKTKKGLKISIGNGLKSIWSISTFLKIWTGTIIAIEPSNQKKKALTFRHSWPYGLAALLATSIFSLFLTGGISAINLFHLSISLGGLILSLMIINFERGKPHVLVERLCSNGNGKSCDSILTSQYSYLFNDIKVSHMTLVFFTGSFFYWFLTGLQHSSNHVLMMLLYSASIPITIVSIYIQRYVLKTWCPLCLGIAAIYLFQFIALIRDSNANIYIGMDLTQSLLCLTSMLSATLLWATLIPLLGGRDSLTHLQVEHGRFKRNESIFRSLLNQGALIDTEINDPLEIKLGASQAPIKLTIITNPFCQYCKMTHTDLKELLKLYDDHFFITIRFNAFSNDVKNEGFRVARLMMESFHRQGPQACLSLMDSIYGENDTVNGILESWQFSNEIKCAESLIKQREWCISNDLNFTPAIILNNRRYPTDYKLSELKYFILELSEKKENVIENGVLEYV